MEIYPQDLSPGWHARILQQRTITWETGASSGRRGLDPVGKELTPFERFWSGAVGREPERHGRAVAAVRPMTHWMFLIPALSIGWLPLVTGWLGLAGQMPAFSALLLTAGTAAGTIGGGLATARVMFERLHWKPLRPSELTALLDRLDLPLDRALVELLRDAARQEIPEEARDRVRSALHSLTAAAERLPAIQVEPLETGALREQATALQEKARTEPDRMVAESLERRAAAILQRAEAHERSALGARRADALREEILAQIAAFREGLAGLQGQSPDAAGLSELAAAAAAVAQEAVYAADARAELEEAVSDAYCPTGGETAEIARLRPAG